MLATILSFFGGKLQLGIVGLLTITLIVGGVLFGIEKINHSNTKLLLANKINELTVAKQEVSVLKKDQENKQQVIVGLNQQINACLNNFSEYRSKMNKMLKVCSEAKEVPAKDSTLEVLDEKSNKTYIDAINNALSLD
jgi:hypothetical protein